jgi:hypothetical protein
MLSEKMILNEDNMETDSATTAGVSSTSSVSTTRKQGLYRTDSSFIGYSSEYGSAGYCKTSWAPWCTCGGCWHTMVPAGSLVWTTSEQNQEAVLTQLTPNIIHWKASTSAATRTAMVEDIQGNEYRDFLLPTIQWTESTNGWKKRTVLAYRYGPADAMHKARRQLKPDLLYSEV